MVTLNFFTSQDIFLSIILFSELGDLMWSKYVLYGYQSYQHHGTFPITVNSCRQSLLTITSFYQSKFFFSIQHFFMQLHFISPQPQSTLLIILIFKLIFSFSYFCLTLILIWLRALGEECFNSDLRFYKIGLHQPSWKLLP